MYCGYKCSVALLRDVVFHGQTHIPFDQTAVVAGSAWYGYKQVFSFRVRNEKIFVLFFNQTYVVCAQKNRLNETVLLRTHNIC